MSALDSDVIKTYAELGLGIGILASMAYNAEKDSSLKLLDSNHLFAENTTYVAVRQGHFLRGFAYKFIELCNQNLTENAVRSTVNPSQ
jgi:LysR family cys regulon transcriptional activator